MDKVLLNLLEIERNGIAVEEVSKEDLIEYITEIKQDIKNVITLVESNNEELITALKYSHRFASRDDMYDKAYVDDILTKCK